MQMSVQNAASFVSDPLVKAALASSIASVAGVQASQVVVELDLYRRLMVARSLSEVVVVSYTIWLDALDEVATLADALQSVSLADVSDALQQEMQQAGLGDTYGAVEVSSFSASQPGTSSTTSGGDLSATSRWGLASIQEPLSGTVAAAVAGICLVGCCAGSGLALARRCMRRKPPKRPARHHVVVDRDAPQGAVPAEAGSGAQGGPGAASPPPPDEAPEVEVNAEAPLAEVEVDESDEERPWPPSPSGMPGYPGSFLRTRSGGWPPGGGAAAAASRDPRGQPRPAAGQQDQRSTAARAAVAQLSREASQMDGAFAAAQMGDAIPSAPGAGSAPRRECFSSAGDDGFRWEWEISSTRALHVPGQGNLSCAPAAAPARAPAPRAPVLAGRGAPAARRMGAGARAPAPRQRQDIVM